MTYVTYQLVGPPEVRWGNFTERYAVLVSGGRRPAGAPLEPRGYRHSALDTHGAPVLKAALGIIY